VKAEGRLKMQIECLWSVALQIGNPLGTELYLAHALVGFFALLLFLLSLLAWSRRRHVGLLLVSLAFLIFCLKEILWLLIETYGLSSSIDLITILADLVVLGLFFVAITLRPRKQLE